MNKAKGRGLPNPATPICSRPEPLNAVKLQTAHKRSEALQIVVGDNNNNKLPVDCDIAKTERSCTVHSVCAAFAQNRITQNSKTQKSKKSVTQKSSTSDRSKTDAAHYLMVRVDVCTLPSTVIVPVRVAEAPLITRL